MSSPQEAKWHEVLRYKERMDFPFMMTGSHAPATARVLSCVASPHADLPSPRSVEPELSTCQGTGNAKGYESSDATRAQEVRVSIA